MNDAVIAVLYNTLAHPPASFVGSDVSFATAPAQPVANGQQAPSVAQGTSLPRFQGNFRSADGSGNNPLMPGLGKAGTPYARSVQSRHPLPANVLPDTGLVFDSLLKARNVSLFSMAVVFRL